MSTKTDINLTKSIINRITNLRNILLTIDIALILPLLLFVNSMMDIYLILAYTGAATLNAIVAMIETKKVYLRPLVIATAGFAHFYKRSNQKILILSVIKILLIFAFLFTNQ